MTKIKITACILSYKRENNLPLVIRGLKRQSFLDKIYIFHNYPSSKKIKGVINIFSEKNFGCIARHAIALLLDSDYVLFVDDDLELKADFSERFLKAIKISKDSIIGFFGRNIKQGMQKLYSNGENIKWSPIYRFVDVIKGRVQLVPFKAFLNSFDYIQENKLNLNLFKNADDVILNLTNQLITKKPSLIIPTQKDEIIELSENNTGVSNKSDHLKRRDALIDNFIKTGWHPLATNKLYFNTNHTLSGEIFLRVNYGMIFDKNYNNKAIKNLTEFIEEVGKKNICVRHLYQYVYLLFEKEMIKEAKSWVTYLINRHKKSATKIFNYMYPLFLKDLDTILLNKDNCLIDKIKFHIQFLMKSDFSKEMIYNHIGRIRKTRNVGVAIELYEYFILLDKSKDNKITGLSYFHLGNLHYKKNNFNEAVRCLKKCLKYIPNHKSAKKSLIDWIRINK